METSAKLRQVKVDSIVPNPENPRLVFRQEEMDNLLVSIRKYGVQVPIVVYQDRDRFVLIDGERRWRTCQKLNLPTIPAIVQSKPNELDNLLMMFNIHSLREQWDYFTIANKLTRIIDLIEKRSGKQPNEAELSEETGLTRGTIRRCKLLIALPERFKDVILQELEKPKPKQKLTEDFFLEMEQNLKTVNNNLPEAIDDMDRVRNVLIKKYQSGLINNLVDFRKVGKLATAPNNVEFGRKAAQRALQRIFEDNREGIESVYRDTVGTLYEEKRLVSTFSNTLWYIENLGEKEKKDEEIRDVLLKLRRAIDRLLKVEA